MTAHAEQCEPPFDAAADYAETIAEFGRAFADAERDEAVLCAHDGSRIIAGVSADPVAYLLVEGNPKGTAGVRVRVEERRMGDELWYRTTTWDVDALGIDLSAPYTVTYWKNPSQERLDYYSEQQGLRTRALLQPKFDILEALAAAPNEVFYPPRRKCESPKHAEETGEPDRAGCALRAGPLIRHHAAYEATVAARRAAGRERLWRIIEWAGGPLLTGFGYIASKEQE